MFLHINRVMNSQKVFLKKVKYHIEFGINDSHFVAYHVEHVKELFEIT